MSKWYDEVNAAYEVEAAKLIADGCRLQASPLYRGVYVKDGRAVALVRSLGQIDWRTTAVIYGIPDAEAEPEIPWDGSTPQAVIDDEDCDDAGDLGDQAHGGEL